MNWARVWIGLIDGIQYGGATVAFLGPTHRFLCSYSVLHGDSDVGNTYLRNIISNLGSRVMLQNIINAEIYIYWVSKLYAANFLILLTVSFQLL